MEIGRDGATGSPLVDFFVAAFRGLVILVGDDLGSLVGDILLLVLVILDRFVEECFVLRLLEGPSSVVVISFSASDFIDLLSFMGEPSCGVLSC